MPTLAGESACPTNAGEIAAAGSKFCQSPIFLGNFALISEGFIVILPAEPYSNRVLCGLERLTKADQAYAVAAAAAHDFNEELTVILSSVNNSIRTLEPGHPARAHLVELQIAAERCARTTSGLLAFSYSRGFRPVATPFEALISN